MGNKENRATETSINGAFFLNVKLDSLFAGSKFKGLFNKSVESVLRTAFASPTGSPIINGNNALIS